MLKDASDLITQAEGVRGGKFMGEEEEGEVEIEENDEKGWWYLIDKQEEQTN